MTSSPAPSDSEAAAEEFPPTISPAGDDGPFADDDRDALHILPLGMIPVQTPGLKRARLIKNARLETVVEVFQDRSAGSGQVNPEHLATMYPSHAKEMRTDMAQIHRLTQLNSYDVYSLRIELRRLGIPVEDVNYLRLSAGKRLELTTYMRDFTLPLIQQVYGSEQRPINDIADLFQLLANPDREEALRNLTLLSQKLNIQLQDIPNFLEEYGDVFLSLAYFRSCLDGLVPEVQRFMAWVNEATKSEMITRDRLLMKMISDVMRMLTGITTSITGRFEAFDRRSKDFWHDINADSFRSVRAQLSAHHVTIGGVLCGLAVKMALWKARFPHGGGGPMKRVEFVRSEILPGLDHISRIEKSAAGTA
ncbi:hypothetical protein [Nitrospirillum viridazoti]|uniref:hypothetical protein n=1 Tax=Nitrospirillum viridazoti TaxID=3144925 RepID=UPI0011ABCB25|nr:hypothetical protein [Nitrospirillum amazonense]TWB42262.1 hypothetical protein FBZ91_103278 [Nitrospirillum amazonense]